MTLAEVMEELRRRDIHLYFENGQLRCRAPSGALDSEMRAAIAAHKNEFRAFLCSSQRKAPPIEPVARDDVLPLSFGQERLWFLDRIDPGSAAYNVPLAVEIEGELNVAALERSFNELIRRHEILRTTYEMRDRRPVQRIGLASTISLPVQDIRHLPESRRLEEALELARADARAPFDLASGPMLRVRLLLMRSDRAAHAAYVLVIVFHHIVTDDWSSVVFFKELGSLYSAFTRGAPFPLAPMNIQYGDFAVAQRNWLQGPVLDDHLSYWRSKLDGATATLDLPKRRKRKGTSQNGSAEFRFAIATSICDGLRRLGRDFGATQFMILLATFDVLLCRYTGQRDICVGTVIANRNWIDTEGLLGFFTNTLVLRADLSEDPFFLDFLGRMRTTTLEAQAHQDLPFERLVQALRPSIEEVDGAQLFRAAIVFHKMDFEQVVFPGVKVRSLKGIEKRAAFELVLHLTEEEGGLLGRFEYDGNAFDGDLIERMAGHFERLLESVASNPRTRISALPMLSDAERGRMLVDWNDTARDYFEDYGVHELFEEQAARSFDAVAAVFGDQRLTYRELNARANQLARYLVRCGVGPETIIGICVERSLEMIVCLLAVLKAGGAYIPLDLDCPDERLDFMIADAKPLMILTRRELQERLPRGVRTFRLDADWLSVEGESKDNLGRRAASQNLAYVIYTSGSTGRPKGVAITHGGVVNYTQAVLTKFPEGKPPLDFALVSTFGADLGNTALYASLASGGRLHILGRDTVADPALIGAYIREHCIDVLKITPSHFDAIAHPAEAGICPREALVFGGESLPSEVARRAASANPQCRIFNHYGPTETTVGVLMLPFGDIGSDTTTVALGRPIFNTRIFVVDPALAPVPVGVAGELLIGGVGLARGYVGRPDLTAERFIPSPFGPPGDRLYRTGDLARYRPDGVIEFLGRIDHQVKVRGYRVELGEIETALSQIAEVRASAVVADEGRAGGSRLVAYVMANEGARVTSEGLRAALRRSLPEYMTPSAFVMVDALPLTRNGKIDRKALPAAGFEAWPTHRYVPPRTVTEESLCRIWAEVLGLERVGVEDNFFQLGGHSLLAVQATARISHAMSISLPLRVFYEASSLSAVAESVDILMELRPRDGSIVSMTADGLEEVEI